MIINDYAVKLDSSHELTSYSKKEEKLVTWNGFEDARKQAYARPVSVNLSDAALQKLKDAASSAQNPLPLEDALGIDFLAQHTVDISAAKKTAKSNFFGVDELDPEKDQNYMILKLLEDIVYRSTGKHIKLKAPDASDMMNSDSDKESVANDIMAKVLAASSSGGTAAAGQPQPQGWGLDYSYSETNYESEKMSFSAKAIVKTADGREINIDAQLSMSRKLIQQTSLSVKAGDALIDPLVINFNGDIAGLSDKKFSFDLDADGKTEEISMLDSNSGFLALDKNGDGKVNDGSELFGPSTNNGFKELSAYDKDQNGWIDEKDDVYQKLKVWTVSSDGSKSLISLKDSGVGAIYLGSSKTEFSMTGEDNQKNGQIAKSGFYLNENGSAGIIHEIDLVV